MQKGYITSGINTACVNCQSFLPPRLSVINHKWVKVELRDGGSLPGDEARHIWFTIGSVYTFERNLVIFQSCAFL